MDDEQLERLQEQLDELAKRFGITSKELDKLISTSGKGSADFKNSIISMVSNMNKTDRGYRDLMRSIEDMDEALDKLSDSAEDQVRKEQILDQRQANLRQATLAKFDQDFERAGQTLVEETTKGVGKLVTSLQTGASANEISKGILQGGVNIAAAGLKTAASGVEAFGQAVASVRNPIWAGAGAVIAGFAGVAGAATEAARQLLMFGIEVLSKEIDRTVIAFQKATQVGAGFTEGMTTMRNAAGDAYLTLEEFGNVLTRQAENIARAGLGFEGALQRASGVQNIFAQDNARVRDQLLRLGYSFEEQSDLVFETMADMRRGGLLQRSSDAQIAQQTQEYAENLRVIAAITGEDARKRMQEARTQSANMAVQQQILNLQKTNPEALQKINAMLASMPVELQKGFLQMVTLGSVVDKTTNVAMAQSPAIRDALTSMVGAFKDGTVSQTQAVDEVTRQRGLIARNMEATIDQSAAIGRAALADVGGVVGEVSQFQANLYDQIAGQDILTGKLIRTGLENQKNTTDALTTELIGATKAAQDMKIAIQDEILIVLDDYAKLTRQALELFRNMIDELTGRVKPVGGETEAKTELRQLEKDADIGAFGKMFGSYGDAEGPVRHKIEALRQLTEREGQARNLGRQYSANINQIEGLSQGNGREVNQAEIAALEAKNKEIADSLAQTANEINIFKETVKHLDTIIDPKKNPGTEKAYASGGIATGPISGYSATLHGKEAVVPLPDGDSIPVTMKSTTGSGDGQAQMLEVLQRQLDELRNQTGLTYDMIKHLEKGNRTSREILTSSY